MHNQKNILKKAQYLVSPIVLDYIFMFKLAKESNFLKTTKLKLAEHKQ